MQPGSAAGGPRTAIGGKAMSDEILARIETKLDRLGAGQDELKAAHAELKIDLQRDLAKVRSELRDDLAAIRHEANERQKIHLQILEALTGSRPSGLRQAG
jgi:hypothetical protein